MFPFMNKISRLNDFNLFSKKAFTVAAVQKLK